MGEAQDRNVRAAKLAVSLRMIPQETADRILFLLDGKDAEVGFVELMQQLGHLREDQVGLLNEQLDREPAAPEAEEQERFGETVIARGLATETQVGAALREQAQLAAKGVFKNLGELLVARGVLTSEQVKELVAAQDQVIMRCPACGEKYNVLRAWSAGAKCPTDGSTLEEARKTASVGVAGTLGSETPGGAASPVGTEFGGCRIIELLGRGTTGSVYKAKHTGLNRFVAIKLMPTLSEDPETVKRLLFEARAVAKLEHPNIVQVYDVGFQKGYFFIVMQLLRGETLETRLAELGKLPLPQALDVAREIGEALAAAHAKGIIHRDLKPANVMLMEDGHARLTDFGLAQDAETPDPHEGLVVGTPYYMSPEQWLGHKADERSDLYALGVILQQMLTGVRPFEGENVNELMHAHLKVPAKNPKASDPSLPVGLCAMLKKTMTKPPAKRYRDVPAFLTDLKLVAAGEDPEALGEFGLQVRCGFCESFNPVSEKKCRICGEPLHEAGGPLEIAIRPDETKCPGCGSPNRKGSRVCGGCGKTFCTRCRQRLSVLRGHCHQCLRHLPRR